MSIDQGDRERLTRENEALRREVAALRSGQALLASEEKFTKAFRTSPYAITITRAEDGAFVDVNNAFTTISGFTREEALADSSINMKLWFNEEDRQRVVNELRSGRAVEGRECQFRTKSGKAITGLFSAQVIESGSGHCILSSIDDITGRKREEHALRESEARFRDTVQYLDEGYYSVTLDGTLLAHNMAFNRILGIDPRRDMKGAKLPDFWQNPEDRKEYLKEFKAKDFINNFQINAKTLDGKPIFVIANAHLVKDGDGLPARIDGTFIDITDRVWAEVALKDSLERLEEAQRVARVGSWKWDPAKDEITGTGEFYRLFDVAPEDLASFGQFVGRLHPDDRERVQGDVARALKQDQTYDTDYRVRLCDGGWRDINARGRVFTDSGGKPVRMSGTCLDITGRKRAGALNAARLNLINFSVTHSLDELLEEAINEAEKLSGSVIGFYHFVNDDQETLTLQNWSTRTKAEFCKAEGRGLHYAIAKAGVWVDCVHKRKPVIHNDYVSLPHRKGLPEGHAAVIRELVVPVMRGEKVMAILGVGNKQADYDQADIEVVSLLADLTWETAERKRAEEAIHRLNAGLEQRVRERTADLETANRELEAFAYSVSHDLRAPLRGIDGWSLALEEDYGARLDEQGREYLRDLRGEAQRMGVLIDDLLTLSRVARADMCLEDVDLSALARSIASELQHSEPARRVEFVITPGLRCAGGPVLLRQMLENLIGNAWKFTGKRADARIEVGRARNSELGTRNAGLADDATVYFVRDNGAGFDMAHVTKLFTPFQRLHRTSEFPGTGIGLATVQRILHRHGGRIWAEAGTDQGATFHFTLPDCPGATETGGTAVPPSPKEE